MRRAKRTAKTLSLEPMEARVLLSARVGRMPTPTITVNETTSGALEIHILSAAGAHPFIPLLDIRPDTVRVDGIAFARHKLSADPIDENGDGITDAVLKLSPRRGVAMPPVGSVVWVSGVDRFRLRGRPVVWAGPAVVHPGGTGAGLGTPVAAQAYIGTVGLIPPQFLNLNVLAVTLRAELYGYTRESARSGWSRASTGITAGSINITSTPATSPAITTSPCKCRWVRPSRSTTSPTSSAPPAEASPSIR